MIARAAIAVGLLLLALVPLVADRYLIYLVSQIAIFALFALSFNLLLGYGGLISFGHAAYFAIGAYGVAIFGTTLALPFPLAFLGAIAAAGIAALAIGYFCVRLTAIYFAMLTLAFAQFVWAIAFKWRAVTKGDTGFIGVVIPDALATPARFYYFALAVVAVSAAILWVMVNSAFGRALATTRENPARAEFIGLDVKRIQLIAFTIAGMFAGVAGALFTTFNRTVFPDFAWWTRSAEVIIMTVLGGFGHFLGPALGAAVLILLERSITEVTQYWPTVLGVILLGVLFAFPDGLMGLARSRAPWARRKGGDAQRQQPR